MKLKKESSYMRNRKSTVFIITFSVLILVSVAVSAFLPVSGEEELYDKVIRLHVLANSDSEEDQELKLEVRDTVLETLSGKLSDVRDRESAEHVLTSEFSAVESAAEQKIRELGYDYQVNLSLGEEYYPEKSYEELTMPSGEYMSLKVEIGAAEGKNWWCVVFPPLCLNAATKNENASSKNEDALIEVGFTEEQYRIITQNDKPRYKIKFKILEMLEEWFF